MNAQPNKWIVRWNIALTVLLLATLAISANWVQAANDPPVRVFTANTDDVGGGGFYVTSNKVIDSANFEELVSVHASNLSAVHSHVCIVTGSAQAARTSDASGLYLFALNMDRNDAPAQGSGRFVQFLATPDDDKTQEAVSTVRYFSNVSGGHTFYLIARKNNGASGNMTVTSASIVVACFKKELKLPI